MSNWHLAQVNVARMRWPLEDSRMDGFRSRIDEINALADRSPGFVWRHVDESGSATNTRPFEDPDILFNLSVWESLSALRAFVYKTSHRELIGRRRDWFNTEQPAHMALWWVPAGQLPTIEESLSRLALMRQQGATAQAFSFARPFDPSQP